MISITESRTLIAKIELQNERAKAFELNSFLALFVEGGHFSNICKQIFGIIPINAQTKTYSVSFKPGNQCIIEDLLRNYGKAKEIHNATHGNILISFSKPKPPPTTVTLWPVSHEVTPEILKNLVESNKWGQLERFAFGRHKLFPQFHNAYLHLQISQYNPNLVPDNITMNNNTVMVLKPGDSNVPRCNFCKSKGHTISTCPQKNKARGPRSMRWQPNAPLDRSKPSSHEAAASFERNFPPLNISDRPPRNKVVSTQSQIISDEETHDPNLKEQLIIPSSVPVLPLLQPVLRQNKPVDPSAPTQQKNKIEEVFSPETRPVDVTLDSNNETITQLSRDLNISSSASSGDELETNPVKNSSDSKPNPDVFDTSPPIASLFSSSPRPLTSSKCVEDDSSYPTPAQRLVDQIDETPKQDAVRDLSGSATDNPCSAQNPNEGGSQTRRKKTKKRKKSDKSFNSPSGFSPPQKLDNASKPNFR